ncbi:MAG: hypothetical protein ACE5IY_09090 [bacterium]
MKIIFAKRVHAVIILSLFFFAFNLSNCSKHPQAKASSCRTILVEAEKRYYNAEFSNALALLNFYFNRCTRRGTLVGKKALILLPEIYIKKNDYARAKKATRLLIKFDPTFDPDPNEHSAQFLMLFRGLKREMRPHSAQK